MTSAFVENFKPDKRDSTSVFDTTRKDFFSSRKMSTYNKTLLKKSVNILIMQETKTSLQNKIFVGAMLRPNVLIAVFNPGTNQ